MADRRDTARNGYERLRVQKRAIAARRQIAILFAVVALILAPGYGGSQQDAARGSGRFGVAIVLDVGRGGDGTSRDVTDTPGEAHLDPATVAVTVALTLHGFCRAVGSFCFRARVAGRVWRLRGPGKKLPSAEVRE